MCGFVFIRARVCLYMCVYTCVYVCIRADNHHHGLGVEPSRVAQAGTRVGLGVGTYKSSPSASSASSAVTLEVWLWLLSWRKPPGGDHAVLVPQYMLEFHHHTTHHHA